MRISLAQALFMTPDLLLLDEPTNHLDVHALTWLEEFLQRWEKTVVIVSHDRGFLNDTTTATMFLHNKRLRYYGGNYDTFVKVRSEHRANEEATRANQQQREGHLKNFIQKFGQGAQEDGEAGAVPHEDARQAAGGKGGRGLRRPVPAPELPVRHAAAAAVHLRHERQLLA